MSATLAGAAITASFNGGDPVPCEFSVHTERINVSTLTASKPDMDWTFMDAQGHFHAYDHEGKLPTIVYREEVIPFEGDPDELSDEWDEYVEAERSITHIECGICGEEIDPKRLPDNPHKTIPGRTEYKVTVHAEVPAGRVSVLVNTPGRLWFGFGQGYATGGELVGGQWWPKFEVFCGPMSWRPAPTASEAKPSDVWVGVRERLGEDTPK